MPKDCTHRRSTGDPFSLSQWPPVCPSPREPVSGLEVALLSPLRSAPKLHTLDRNLSGCKHPSLHFFLRLLLPEQSGPDLLGVGVLECRDRVLESQAKETEKCVMGGSDLGASCLDDTRPIPSKKRTTPSDEEGITRDPESQGEVVGTTLDPERDTFFGRLGGFFNS